MIRSKIAILPKKKIFFVCGTKPPTLYFISEGVEICKHVKAGFYSCRFTADVNAIDWSFQQVYALRDHFGIEQYR
jgi:hypothetical protein